VVDIEGNEVELPTVLQKFTTMYMDFNGSAAFFNDHFQNLLEPHKSKLQALLVMGGVLSDEVPQTMVAGPRLNRFSASTMNQFYHPEGTKKLLDFFKSLNIYILSNNAVSVMKSKANIHEF